MKKMILVVTISILAIIACDFFSEHFPAPDPEIIKLAPLAIYVNDSTQNATLDTVYVVPRNSIDGIVNAFFWEFYTPSDVQIGSRSDPIRVHFYIRGLVDTTSLADTCYIYGLSIPVQVAVDHIVNSSDDAAWVKLFMVTEDAYGHEKEDTTWARFGLYYLAGGATIILIANPTSIAVSDSSTVTATLTDFAGQPLQNEILNFSTDICHLSSTQEVTDANGQAIVMFYGDSLGTATVTASHAVASPKSVFITVTP